MDEENISHLDKWGSYALGLVVGAAFSIFVLLLVLIVLAFALGPEQRQALTSWPAMLSYVLLILAGTMLVFASGLREIPPRYNAIPTWLGSPVKIVLSDGWIWWFPKWLGGGIMDKVSVATQTKSFVIGRLGGDDDTLALLSGEGGSQKIYTKDGTPVSVTVFITYRISNPWKWVVEYEGDPIVIIDYHTDRLIRWISDMFNADIFRQLGLTIADVLMGNITDGKVRYKYHVEKLQKDGSVTEDVQVIEYELPRRFIDHSLKKEMEEIGAELISVKVPGISLPEELEKELGRQAQERIQRKTEIEDAETGIIMARNIAEKLGVPIEAAVNVAEAQRGRVQRHAYSFEGSSVLGMLAGILGNALPGSNPDTENASPKQPASAPKQPEQAPSQESASASKPTPKASTAQNKKTSQAGKKDVTQKLLRTGAKIPKGRWGF